MYGKHFVSMYTGSMVGAGLNVFAVWGYAIANVVKSRVELNPKLLSLLLGCDEQEVVDAMDYLCCPDTKSRSKDHDGRRLIKEGEYQYFLPTYEAYRKILNEDERREYNRQKQAESRLRHKKKPVVKERVNDCQQMSTHKEEETEAEAEAE